MNAKEKKQVAEFIQNTNILDILQHTWQVIGGDTLNCLSEMGKKPEMRQSHVIEVVLDAGYIETYLNGGSGGKVSGVRVDNRETVKQFRALTYDQQKAIGKAAFPYKWYGW